MTTLLATQLFGDYAEDEEVKAPQPVPALQQGQLAPEAKTPEVEKEASPQAKKIKAPKKHVGIGVYHPLGLRDRATRLAARQKAFGVKPINMKAKPKEESPKPVEEPQPANAALPQENRDLCEKKRDLGYRKWKVGKFELGFALVPIVKEIK